MVTGAYINRLLFPYKKFTSLYKLRIIARYIILDKIFAGFGRFSDLDPHGSAFFLKLDPDPFYREK